MFIKIVKRKENEERERLKMYDIIIEIMKLVINNIYRKLMFQFRIITVNCR